MATRWRSSQHCAAAIDQGTAVDIRQQGEIGIWSYAAGNRDAVTVTTPSIPLSNFEYVWLASGLDFGKFQAALFVRYFTNERSGISSGRWLAM